MFLLLRCGFGCVRANASVKAFFVLLIPVDGGSASRCLGALTACPPCELVAFKSCCDLGHGCLQGLRRWVWRCVYLLVRKQGQPGQLCLPPSSKVQ